MTAPSPVPGSNPYTLSYQVEQFDNTWPPAKTVLDSLKTPPASGISAETSPDKLFRENTSPPVGAGG